jgi:rhamnose utilization protein RhaD (predicted bifunctional aldolase and dehydrogenase)
MSDDLHQDLLELSHELGRPERNLAILGEGNTSAAFDQDSFLVKASGSELRTLRPEQVVRVSRAKCAALRAQRSMTDEQITAGLLDAVVEGPEGVRPSVETVMHAALLELDGVAFVGHTHPTAINALTCSSAFGDDLKRRLFPDQVVVCGPSAVLVPYVDPGLPLATAVLDGARAYRDRYGRPPLTIYLKNHGFIALGQSARQVRQVTLMAVKAAEILLGAYAAGGPTFMADADVARIAGRDDEHYRQKVLAQGGG